MYFCLVVSGVLVTFHIALKSFFPTKCFDERSGFESMKDEKNIKR